MQAPDSNAAALKGIPKRIGHVVVSYKHFVLVWGGFMCKSTESDHDERTVYCPAQEVWFYNCITGIWTLGITSGEVPCGMSGSSGVVFEDHLYLYGGMTSSDDRYRSINGLYRLDLTTLQWKVLTPSGPTPPSCDKSVSWSYKKRLYFFGGYGPRPQQPSDYDVHVDLSTTHGWNNNLSGYDPVLNAWFKPEIKGRTPEPRAAHAVAVMENKAFVFGGRVGDIRNNELYYINMDTMTWSANLNENKKEESVPKGRSWLSFNFVGPRRAIVYGGLRVYGVAAMDSWEANFSDNLENVEWTKHSVLVEPRIWHQAAFCAETGELVIVGGVSESPYEVEDEDDHVDSIMILKFQPMSLFRLCLDAAVVLYQTSNHKTCFNALPKMLMNNIMYRVVQEFDRVDEL
ncbi:Kelch domain containing [Nesidiocoris tenuis]|uniref:Kelch domain containing n=1 Tax=Nesidiocoris tenuis TaxID=355587 RepID=A0ABN7BAI5_9HEMI|nr:Kelch domain containing [Nesidiocoris tenuis]